MMDAYSRKLDSTLEQLAAQKKDSKRAQDLKKKAEKLVDQFEDRSSSSRLVEPKEERLPPDTELKRGTRVRIANVNQDGEIVEPPEEGKVVVLIGAMRVTVPIRALERRAGSRRRKSSRRAGRIKDSVGEGAGVRAARSTCAACAPTRRSRSSRSISTTRSPRAPIRCGLSTARAPGTLRKIVWEFLKSHPGVESYRLGEQDEGGSGATMVKMNVGATA